MLANESCNDGPLKFEPLVVALTGVVTLLLTLLSSLLGVLRPEGPRLEGPSLLVAAIGV